MAPSELGPDCTTRGPVQCRVGERQQLEPVPRRRNTKSQEETFRFLVVRVGNPNPLYWVTFGDLVTGRV